MNIRKAILTTILALVALGVASAASAGLVTIGEPTTIAGQGTYVETNNTLQDIAITIFWTSDDALKGTSAIVETGDEACAEIGMDCHDTYTLIVGGASGNELLDSDCTTDQADAVISLSFCN